MESRDKHELNGEKEHKISQHEIDAWNRGKLDAFKNDLLKETNVSADLASKILKNYAVNGDAHFASTKADVPVNLVRKVLSKFKVESIEQAKELVKSGVIAEYEEAQKQATLEDSLEHRAQEAARQEAMDALEREKQRPSKTQEERDIELQNRRDEAQFKNKKDKIRALIEEGIADSNYDVFRIDVSDVGEFKSLVQYGVSALQRRFGGSKQDIVREVKRLAPHIDPTMMRP